ncbi:MAG: anthranilate phosphoribosyltransferase [Chloroflexi bacterium]|nr:anthranilate phosphoribosyltransferase [Chloroflexota bacterium]
MIREAIAALVEGRSLSGEEAASVMGEIMSGEATPAQVGAFLTAMRMKGETAEEIAGMARVMREKALRVHATGRVVDTCGTGGDAKGTFNISTAAAFVVAASGLKVAKHGNRAASGTVGSADVLEAAGVKIDLKPPGVQRCLEEVGIGFMFAQVFHPAMRHVAGPRREMGIRTVFNILGPLTNPAGAQVQVLGVADGALGEKMARVLQLMGVERALVVHGEDGLDELTTTGPSRVWDAQGGSVRSYTVTPEEVGLPRAVPEALKGGGSREQHLAMLRGVLAGQPGAPLDVVLLNAGAAIMAGGVSRDLKEGVARARQAVESGAAAARLEALIKLSQGLE